MCIRDRSGGEGGVSGFDDEFASEHGVARGGQEAGEFGAGRDEDVLAFAGEPLVGGGTHGDGVEKFAAPTLGGQMVGAIEDPVEGGIEETDKGDVEQRTIAEEMDVEMCIRDRD